MKRYFFCFFFILTCFQSLQAEDGLLWSITGEDLEKPSYLFGHLHSTDERVFQIREPAAAAFINAEAFVYNPPFTNVFADMIAMLQIVMNDNGSLRKLMDEQVYKICKGHIEEATSLPAAMFDNILPFYTTEYIAELNESEDPNAFFDTYLTYIAEKKEKNIFTLQVHGSLVDLLQQVPYIAQAKYLWTTLSVEEAERKEIQEQVILCYQAEESRYLRSLYKAWINDDELFNVVVDQQNLLLVEEIEKYIKYQGLFISVDAHLLSGEQGLVALLREKGYLVEKI